MATPTDRRGWRRWLRRTPVLTALVVLVLAGAGVGAWAAVGASSTGYEVATTGYGDVQQTLDLTGTVEPVDEATVDFQVSGKVASVDVSAGQSVTSGEVLASLDASSLQAAVTQDQSTLSADQDKLASDEASESSDPSSSDSSSTASSSSSSGSSSSSSSTSGESSGLTGSSETSSGGSSSGSLTSQISSAQQQLVADQHTADTMEVQESGDLATANSDCGTSGGSGGPGSGGSGSGGSGSGSSSSNSSQCSAALSQVLTDQQQEASDLAGVAQDETSLSKLLSEEQSALAGSGTGSGHGSGSSGTETAATPATIASDQAAIDAEQADLDEAQQSLNEAQLTTPLAGVVAAVNLTVDQNVSAGSTSADVIVQGPESFEVIGDVAPTDLSDVQVGNTATVVPDGYSDSISGTVSAVSNMPTSSSSSSSGDYQVTVTLPANTPGLYNGSDAEVSIVTGEAQHVLTVPTSAVHALGREYYVDVLNKGTSKLKVVGVGTMGDELTQVTSGLTAGVPVILANLSTPLPTGSSTSGPGGIISLEGGGGFSFRISGAGGSGITRGAP